MRKWKLELRDNTIIDIPAQAVKEVRKRITAKEPLSLKTRVIPFSQIEKFYETEEDDTHLLAEASQVFNEPELNPDGSIIYTWVKKTIPADRWTTHYSKIPGYQRIEQLGGSSVIAFRLPFHKISRHVNKCTPQEVRLLEND